MKPLSLVARLILTIVILAASAACGGQSPLSTLGTGPSSIDAESAASDAVSGTRALSSGNITITYAQGQDRPKSLHVQWVGDVDTCVIEVWYGRYTEDVVERIARFETDSREIHFRVPSQFVGGRYRVMICGVQSRLMYLDGKANDTTQRPVPPVTPPGNEQPTAPPVDPPVNPPSNDDDGDDESNPGPGAATGGDDAGGEDTGGGNNGGSTGGGNNGQCNASSRPQGGNNNGGGSGNTGGNTDPNPGRGCDSGNPGQGHL